MKRVRNGSFNRTIPAPRSAANAVEEVLDPSKRDHRQAEFAFDREPQAPVPSNEPVPGFEADNTDDTVARRLAAKTTEKFAHMNELEKEMRREAAKTAGGADDSRAQGVDEYLARVGTAMSVTLDGLSDLTEEFMEESVEESIEPEYEDSKDGPGL